MPEIVHPLIESYLASLRTPRDEILLEMERIAEAEEFPILGPDVGKLLHILAKFGGARRVLELGSGFGYSAYWFATALPEDGMVHCTEWSEFNRDRAMDFFTRAHLSHKVRFHMGDALKAAEDILGPFDIVFCDIDKEEYPETIELVAPKMRPGGLFITDNTLWHGKVADTDRLDAPTRGVMTFNAVLTNHPDFETVIVPIRDGISVSMKIR